MFLVTFDTCAYSTSVRKTQRRLRKEAGSVGDSPQPIRRDFHGGQADMGQAERRAEELAERREGISGFPGGERKRAGMNGASSAFGGVAGDD